MEEDTQQLVSCQKYNFRTRTIMSQYRLANLATYNPGKNIWHKVKKSSKIGQDFKSLLSNFACFLTAIVKV